MHRAAGNHDHQGRCARPRHRRTGGRPGPGRRPAALCGRAGRPGAQDRSSPSSSGFQARSARTTPICCSRDIDDDLTFPMPPLAELEAMWSMSASTRSAKSTEKKPPPKTAKDCQVAGGSTLDKPRRPYQPRSATTVLLSCRMSAMHVRAPAVREILAELGAGVAAADEADRRHAGGRGGGDAGGRILDHDAFGPAQRPFAPPRATAGPGRACRSAPRLRRRGSARRTAPARWSRGWPGCGPGSRRMRHIWVRAAR